MNRAALDALPLLPFFLPASGGQRYCLLHLPPPGRGARGGIVYVHPFAEELNKSRHVAAAQARAFASFGYSVLQIDLFGCGDSSGDFGEARWDIWHNDLHLACAWLAQRVDGPLTLWGLRLGALLALDFASRAPLPLARLLLWQPELDGRRVIDRFLRLRLASGMLAGGAPEAPGQARAALAQGDSVEVAGYLLAPELAHAIDGVSASALQPSVPPVPVYWLDYQGPEQASSPLPPLARQWRDQGAAVHVASFGDGPFWHSGELLACPQLLDATRALCRDWLDEERTPP
ncbi:MAG: hydrolase 2, exosortase A system-associated [Janthinobacterium sp.]